MDISVIVPVWCVENYIEQCLRSLFNQTKTDGVEFILVNDCTPDRSMEIARQVIVEYPKLTIRIIEHTENRNVSATRQTGVDAAIGDYIIQIDSDDWCEPTMLEDMYAKAIESDADILYCDFIEEKYKKQVDCKTGFDAIESLFNDSYLFTPSLWNKLIRRTLYTNYNITINDVKLYTGEDYYAIVKLCFFTDKIVYLPSAYYHYRQDNTLSLTKKIFSYKDASRFIILIEEFFNANNCRIFENSLLTFKATHKLIWLAFRGHSIKKQRECIKYFPEADRYLIKSSRFSLATRVPYFFATHGFLYLANFLFKTKARLSHFLKTKRL